MTGPATPSPASRPLLAVLRDPEVLGIAILAVVLRAVFMVATGRIWEDALITVAHARNAVEGLGLTHHAGEPVTHGFTSVASVLLPVGFEAIVRDSGIIGIQLVSLAASVLAVVYAANVADALGLSRAARFLVIAFLAVETNHVFYGAAGMETQIAVALLLASIYYTVRERWVGIGLTLGLCVLARPDYLLWWACALGYLAIRRRDLLLRTAGLAIGVVAPWLLFATVYYGSPVPQTIVAKAASFSTLPGAADLLPWLIAQVVSHLETIARSLTPYLADTMVLEGPLPRPILWVVAIAAFFLVLHGALSVRRQPRWWPVIAFAGLYGIYRILLLPGVYNDWYVPSHTAVLVLLLAAGVDGLRLPRARSIAVAVGLAAVYLLPYPSFIVLERQMQSEVEDSVRRNVAAYLSANVRDGEPVTAESAGYIGYESRVLLYDYPGLTSRASLAALTGMPRAERTIEHLVASLRPTWVVLRPYEHARLVRLAPELAARYQPCYGVGPGGDVVEGGGIAKRSIDLRFEVYRLDGCP